jgi:type IV secretion system protein VirD4
VDYAPYAADPLYILQAYIGLLKHWLTYGSQLGADYVMKLFVPFGAALLLFAATIFTIRAPLLDYRPFSKKESLHGDARWANERDIKKAGLRAKKGMLMGQDKKGYLIAGGYQHCLLFAPTGSGKGVGFVIPNLLFWEDSMAVHDIKLENYELTSGYRQKVLKQEVYLWNPASPDGITHCYNPIDWVSPKMGQMVDDVQKIANLLLPEQEFWQNEARSLFVGVVLYLLAVPEKIKSLLGSPKIVELRDIHRLPEAISYASHLVYEEAESAEMRNLI